MVKIEPSLIDLVEEFAFGYGLEVLAVGAFAVGFCAFHELVFVDEAIDEGDFFGSGNSNALSVLDYLDKYTVMESTLSNMSTMNKNNGHILEVMLDQ